MEQKIIFNPDYSSISPKEERVLFTLHPSILAIWPVFAAIPLALVFALASYSSLCSVYDAWFSKPEWARDVAWSLASSGDRHELRTGMLFAIGSVVGFVCLIIYILKCFRLWKEKKIEITNANVIYIEKDKARTYSINQIVSFTGGKGYFFKDASYSLNTNEVISVEYVRASTVNAANNYINSYINGKKSI